MPAELREREPKHPSGTTQLVAVADHEIMIYRTVHDSGIGPGLLLVSDRKELDESIQRRADLFGAEGYSVLACGNNIAIDSMLELVKLLRGFVETDGDIVAVGHGNGAYKLILCAELTDFRALVGFDTMELHHDESAIAKVKCPLVLQFGTLDAPQARTLAANLKILLNKKDGSRVFDWSEAGPGFSLPLRKTFEKRVDSLAHTRTLEVIRRVVGPYYDFAALFAEHTYHEFTTKDVDATMETMIDEPYVNHVPTLAGGVGHDMLKRFYKYHFVNQNSGGRDRLRISYTLGSDRVVLESYTKFRHDAVIDRYFPNIPPTGKLVEIATVIIVKFRGDKVCHEHLYWDQGSALKQIGVLQADGLPIAGAEAARKILDETLPSNIFMQEAWATSEGKPI